MLELIRKCSKDYNKAKNLQRAKKGREKKKNEDSNLTTLNQAEKGNSSKINSSSKKSNSVASSNWLAFKATGALEEEVKKSKTAKKKSTDFSKGVKSSFPHRLKSQNKSDDDNVHFNSIDVKTNHPLDSKTKEERKILANSVALDCEMVGVFDGHESALARVSIVNHDGECIFDKFVKPKEHVVDYRTHVSGVRPCDLRNAESFETVQKEVAAILKGKILVGHALQNDLKALLLSHPPRMIRDTSSFKLFKDVTNGRNPSLKKLAAEILGITIQSGEHSSVEDAKAAMQLYNLYQSEWENFKAKKKAQRIDTSLKWIDPRSAPGKPSKKPLVNPLMDEFTAF